MEYPYIREAHYDELPQVAHLTAKAFWDDDLVGQRMHPHRNEYPDDFDLFFLQRARANYFNPRWRFIVAVVQDSNGREKLAGCGQWTRFGDGGKSMDYSWFDPRAYAKGAMTVAMKGHAVIWPNRAADPKEEDLIDRVMASVADAWTGERADAWYLEWMAVHPDYQGKGHGKRIVTWGLKQAQQDGVYASLISARGKEPFYRKCGFDIEDGHLGKGEGNPLTGWQGGQFFWKAPEGKR